jgi:AraC family transcriptional regulator, ethanolamine operon transcriptional activator
MIADPLPNRHPWITRGHFRDIDAQAAQYHGYEQQYQQLSRGPFEGRFSSFNFGDDLVINLETANRELAASAATPPGRYGACFLTDNSPPCALNATSFSQDHLVLSPEKRCVEGRMAEGVTMYCMDLSRSLFPDDSNNVRSVGVLADPVGLRQLRGLVQTGLATFTTLESPADYPAAVCGFKSSIADLLWQLAARTTDHERTQRYSNTRAIQIFRRAREYIHHGLADGISIVTLCRHSGVSRRSLESIFQSVVGMGPGSYVRTLQLNRIRRDLMSQGSEKVSIGVIAARHGIWHWSRFSRYYRSLFGELPSQTRAMTPAIPAPRMRRGTRQRRAVGAS